RAAPSVLHRRGPARLPDTLPGLRQSAGRVSRNLRHRRPAGCLLQCDVPHTLLRRLRCLHDGPVLGGGRRLHARAHRGLHDDHHDRSAADHHHDHQRHHDDHRAHDHHHDRDHHDDAPANHDDLDDDDDHHHDLDDHHHHRAAGHHHDHHDRDDDHGRADHHDLDDHHHDR